MCDHRNIIDLFFELFSVISPGGDATNVAVTESNGDSISEHESGEMWPPEMDTDAGSPASVTSEEKDVSVSIVPEDEISTAEDRLVADHLEEQPLEKKNNCEGLSPRSELDDTEADPVALETIFIAPLDGSQAELRSRVIKEVRRPGRSECALYHVTLVCIVMCYCRLHIGPFCPSLNVLLLRLQGNPKSTAAGERTCECTEVLHSTGYQRSCQVRNRDALLSVKSLLLIF